MAALQEQFDVDMTVNYANLVHDYTDDTTCCEAVLTCTKKKLIYIHRPINQQYLLFIIDK